MSNVTARTLSLSLSLSLSSFFILLLINRSRRVVNARPQRHTPGARDPPLCRQTFLMSYKATLNLTLQNSPSKIFRNLKISTVLFVGGTVALFHARLLVGAESDPLPASHPLWRLQRLNFVLSLSIDLLPIP